MPIVYTTRATHAKAKTKSHNHQSHPAGVIGSHLRVWAYSTLAR